MDLDAPALKILPRQGQSPSRQLLVLLRGGSSVYVHIEHVLQRSTVEMRLLDPSNDSAEYSLKTPSPVMRYASQESNPWSEGGGNAASLQPTFSGSVVGMSADGELIAFPDDQARSTDQRRLIAQIVGQPPHTLLINKDWPTDCHCIWISVFYQV